MNLRCWVLWRKRYIPPDESVFGDAPLPFPGLPFIDAVDEEGYDVDADKVDYEVVHGGTCADKVTMFVIQMKNTLRGLSAPAAWQTPEKFFI